MAHGTHVCTYVPTAEEEHLENITEALRKLNHARHLIVIQNDLVECAATLIGLAIKDGLDVGGLPDMLEEIEGHMVVGEEMVDTITQLEQVRKHLFKGAHPDGKDGLAFVDWLHLGDDELDLVGCRF